MKTNAAMTPKMNCETTNHGQSIWLRTVGLTNPSDKKLTAVHSSGINRAPHASGLARVGSIGIKTPYSRPSVSETVTWIATATTNKVG
jgi:hypothetical protein